MIRKKVVVDSIMPSKLELFLNGDPNGKNDKERSGRKVTDKEKPFTLWSFDNKTKWFIDDDDRDEFLKLYCGELRKCVPQYLTERSTPIGQLRIDLDLKYEGRVEEHKHTVEQVAAFVQAYMAEVKRYLEVPENVEIYVLEKEYPTFDPTKGSQKDGKMTGLSSSGVHIQIPSIKSRASIEQAIRRTLVPRMEEFFPNLGLFKGWDDVYDKAPLTHTGNWPLLGSKKKTDSALPYEIKYMLDWDSETGETSMDTDVPSTITPEIVNTLSVRSRKEDETKLTEEGEKISRPIVENVTRAVSRGRGMERDVNGSRGSSPGRNYIAPLSETKKEYYSQHVKNLKEERYTNYVDWIAVGQCLKNIHPDLEDVWLDFSSQIGQGFKEHEALSKWNSFGFRVEGERLSEKSLRMWSRTDNFEHYQYIENNNVDRLVEMAAGSMTEYDVAQVIFAKYRDEFKFTQFKQNDWYQYVGHIWKSTDNGVELHRRLSSDIANLFLKKEEAEINNIKILGDCGHKDGDPTCPVCQAEERKKQYSAARIRMKKTGFKESVMKECRILFYDKDFAQKLDENKHLIAFNNCVFDTLTQKPREGCADDCISFCTNIDYALDTEYHQFQCWPEVEKFLKSILPNTNVREYFLKHMATCLSGVFNQRFHILTGSGSNGKSMLMNLCSTAFGDYCYKANIAMFTQKRGKAGAASPEMVRMKGRRFVMMSEPDEGEPLSTGFMKEITSSEKVSARDLYAGSKQMVEFDVQAKCHLACNDKPKVNTTDGGTWRRLKVIDFPNKFVHEPRAANELPVDESIMHKVLSKEWAECFMAYLVHLYIEGKGLAKLVPPKEVDAYTNEYKEDSDSIAKFISEKISEAIPRVPGGANPDAVMWTAIMASFQEWKRNNEVKNGSVAELRKRIESEYGKMPTGGWTNFRFEP